MGCLHSITKVHGFNGPLSELLAFEHPIYLSERRIERRIELWYIRCETVDKPEDQVRQPLHESETPGSLYRGFSD